MIDHNLKTWEEREDLNRQLRLRSPADVGAAILAAGNVLSFERGMRILRSGTDFLAAKSRLWSQCKDQPVYDDLPPSAA